MRMRSLGRRGGPVLLIIAFWLALIISAATRGDTPTTTAATAPPDSLSASWSAAMRDLHVPGMIVVTVDRDHTVRTDVLGLRDVERNLPMDPDTRVYIASCTKPFVACAAAVLAAEGKLDLDAPVRRYLPKFDLADHGYADSVTVRDLLAHKPGLKCPPITFGDAYTGQMNDERYYRLLAATKPRRSFSYSNLHYTLVGRVIEAVTHKSWKDVLAERIFKPAGMTRTTCSASRAEADRNVAIGYDYERGATVRATPPKVDATMHAAGGIYTTANDLARWLRLQLGNGTLDGRRVLPAQAIATMRELLAPDAAEAHPLIKSEKRIAWGAGWDIRTFDADTLYCHNGNFAGAGAFISILPGRNLGVAVASNGSGASVMLAEVAGAQAYDAALGRAQKNDLTTLAKMAASRTPPDTPLTANGTLSLPAHSYKGEFANDDWGVVRIDESHGVLSGSIGALALPIRLTGKDGFSAAGYHGRFELDATGHVAALWMDTAAPDSVRFQRRR
ncbi:MAG TPA: serine hydrolase domain-containing protein [Candidatus Krumholzibacteria bacterium]|nr:serine hydrolase domain-containing protein [Candidatus Krumholzibacteria bacterium]